MGHRPMYCSNSDDAPCVDDGGYVNVKDRNE